MRRVAIVGLIVFLLLGVLAPGQIKEGVIPFELKTHIIVVKVKINDSNREFDFIVDTGGRMLVDRKIASELHLERKGFGVKMDSLTAAGFRIEEVSCSTGFDFEHLERLKGFPLHGMIGSDLLERFKVTFDYKKSHIILSSDTRPLSKPAPGTGYLLPLKNHPLNNSPMVKIKLNRHRETEAIIDTGQPFALALPLEFLHRLNILEGKDWIKSKGIIYKWPMTSPDTNYLYRVRSLGIETLEIKDPLTFTSIHPPPLNVPLLGMDFLAQFIVTINYPRDEILLVRRKEMVFKTNDYSIGLRARKKIATNGISVQGVWTGSPADEAGIRVRDEIVKVNGKPVTSDNLFELTQILADDKVKNIRLTLKNGQGLRTVHLQKKNLLPR